MGDSARAKRREQLKRWDGSCTDKASAVARRRCRGNAENGSGEPEAELSDPLRDQPGSVGREESSPLLKRRKRVRFDRAAEFLAACASGDTEEAKIMLMEAKETKRKNGEDVAEIINCSNADGITALHQACIDGSMEMVSFLLDHSANVNQVDSEGWTPLHVAASCGYRDIADFLLQEGASLSAVNCDGDVPLDIALDESTESLLQDYTLRQGVDLEAAKRMEEEQIMSDARTWLNEGPPSDVQHPRTGATPLHVAAAKGYVEALKILCQVGLDVSAVDFDGWTPLHAAAHWGQGEACRILAEQLCNMEARSNGGQTPFDVADESVEELLEELSQKQAKSILDRQNQQGSTAANTQNKKRRSSVCRMSSKDKMNVQDQSKERGVSGGLELSEEKESSPESSTLSSPDTESVTTSTVSSADKTPEEKDDEVKEQDKANRTARVQPTPQTRENMAESPNTPNTDKRKKQQFQAPARDEESESQRKARSRLMRQSRRSTQGVTLTDLKEAEKTVPKAADPPLRNIQPVSPIVTVTPAERDTDPVKQEEPEADRRLGVRDRRRGRRERRSTGIVQPGGENEDEDAHSDDTNSNTPTFAVSLLQSCETQGTSSGTPVFVQTGKDLLLHVEERVEMKKGSDFKWSFNGSTNIVKFFAKNDPIIYDDYEGRVEFSVQNYTLCLKNVQRSDSGRYTATVSANINQVVADYKVTVLDPVSPVKLTVDSVSSSSDCNFTVTCSTLDSLISSTFLCHNETCSLKGGERSEVTLYPSMNVYLKQGFIICNHSNQVSLEHVEQEIKHHCEQHPVSNGATRIGIAGGVAGLGIVLVIICSIFIFRYYNKKSIGKTIYEVPQDVNPAQSQYEDPRDKELGPSPTSTYCLVEFHTGPVKPPRNTSQPETIYAQVNRAAKTNCKSPNTKHPELKNMDDNDVQD